MKNIIVILGTRPEAIKLAPVILSLRQYTNYTTLVCNTEQQKELSHQALSFFGIKADITLDTMTHNQTLASSQSTMLIELSKIFATQHIDATIVQGDTMTAFCGALTSFYHKIPVFHVEAGLRSYNIYEPFPEEAIRRMITPLVHTHFTPTQKATEALLQENIPQDNIVLVGNTVIDALLCLPHHALEEAKDLLLEYGLELTQPLIFITVHRRENQGERLHNIIEAIHELSIRFPDYQFIIPVHPNPNVSTYIHAMLGTCSSVYLLPPLPYPAVVLLMQHASVILTDSGGIQEEAPTFGTPLLVLRCETERKEGVEAGVAHLIGTQKKAIIDAVTDILSRNAQGLSIQGENNINPYGDGYASQRIAHVLQEYWQ